MPEQPRIKLEFEVVGRDYDEVVGKAYGIALDSLPDGTMPADVWMGTIEARRYGDVISAQVTVIYPGHPEF